jgi:hypothetical protein
MEKKPVRGESGRILFSGTKAIAPVPRTRPTSWRSPHAAGIMTLGIVTAVWADLPLDFESGRPSQLPVYVLAGVG